MLRWVQDVTLQIYTLWFLKFKRRYVSKRIQLKMNHFNQLFTFKVEVINRSLKQLSKVSVRCRSQEYLSGKFLKIIVKGFVAGFICSKILCFQHILINTFRRMRLNYENCSLRCILFYTLKQH